LAVPLDAGCTLFGRRLFGAHKTLRGFVIMVPATGACFALLAALLERLPPGLEGLWPLSASSYALVGLWAGLGFMAGELPNSFIKRQIDVAPGEAAGGRFTRPLFLALDRLDSIAGMLVALALIVPVPAQAWLYVLLVGPLLHGSFSVALFQLGVKARAA
jgi:CDP-2,3-bis-(O-geranylgeranyl)-sn-glycerol synthase